MIKTRKFNEEVLFTRQALTKLNKEEIGLLKEKARHAKRQRIRLCAHKGPDEAVHEMFIVHKKGAYVRPHKHINKFESFYVIEGGACVLLFTSDGRIKEVIRAGEYNNKKVFYCRIPQGVYHMLIILSDWLIFSETTMGPFRPKDTVFALWAPEENDVPRVEKFISNLRGRLSI